jgi:AraC family transcriptional regulator
MRWVPVYPPKRLAFSMTSVMQHGEIPDAAHAATLHLFELVVMPSTVPSGTGDLARWRKRNVEQYLTHSPVDELAALASLSVSHFCRAFRQKFGERPYAYIVRLRLQGAQELMLSGRDRLGHIPLTCTFADQAHFAKALRRELDEASSACRRHVADAACPHRCVRRYPKCWRPTATLSTCAIEMRLCMQTSPRRGPWIGFG